MALDSNSTETTRLRCITIILDLDDEALEIVDTLLTRVAVSPTPSERKPRTKQIKRAAPTVAPVEVAR